MIKFETFMTLTIILKRLNILFTGKWLIVILTFLDSNYGYKHFCNYFVFWIPFTILFCCQYDDYFSFFLLIKIPLWFIYLMTTTIPAIAQTELVILVEFTFSFIFIRKFFYHIIFDTILVHLLYSLSTSLFLLISWV